MMTWTGYKTMLIDGIMEYQQHGQFTRAALEKKNIDTLERIYDSIDTTPAATGEILIEKED